MAQFDTKKTITYLILVFSFAASLYIAFNSTFRENVLSKLGDQREVLSKIKGNLTGSEDTFEVIKVKERNTIALEIYKQMTPTQHKLFHRIQLPHSNDGYFLFHNSSTNLALADIDGDRLPEVIAPTFDKTLTAHLNVVKYSAENQTFYLMLEPSQKD